MAIRSSLSQKAIKKSVAENASKGRTTNTKTVRKNTTAKASVTKSRTTSSKKSITKKRLVAKKQPFSNTQVLTSPASPTINKPSKQHPLGHLLFEQRLRQAGFLGGISTDTIFLEAYETDESIFTLRPQVIIQPKTIDDIILAVQHINKLKQTYPSLSLTPRGGGTGLTGGSLSESVVIDVATHLSHIHHISHHKNEVHIVCDPGVRWHDMEERLKHLGYEVPVHLSSKDICTVGGAVGNNAAGPEGTDHNHISDWIQRLTFLTYDGSLFDISPLTYKQFRTISKEKNAYTSILSETLTLLENNEKSILNARPTHTNNTAGYPLWNICPQGISKWKKGEGTLSLIPIIAGSQGTLGIITSITLRAEPRQKHTTLIAVPLFSLEDAHTVIQKASAYDPLRMEVFDDKTYDLALKNPDFFKKYFSGLPYYRSVLTLYTTHHIRYDRKSPTVTLLITLSDETTNDYPARFIAEKISVRNGKAAVISNPYEEQMLSAIARASYTLLKLNSDGRRPATFLEDVLIPHRHIPQFLTQVRRLFSEYNISATLYGHAGVGHFQFYPLIDFRLKTTPSLIEKLSMQYLSLTSKFKGVPCSEYNDGILRAPRIDTYFSKNIITIFQAIEHLFDPNDIFNPGKKINSKYITKNIIRKK
jgi:FAD/FMN-containing dehydrogenase